MAHRCRAEPSTPSQNPSVAGAAPALDPPIKSEGRLFPFTPTSCSWLNAVETFFAKLARRRFKRGSFHSLVALQEAIKRYLEEHNRDPRPFVWTADPDAIVEKVRRAYHALAPFERHAG
jgi:hypothetical protein